MESNIFKVSDLMNKAQNILIVPHPKRASATLDIENIGNAEILFDAPDVSECSDYGCEANEDPYIWNTNFIYTFCHAYNLLKKVKENDLIVFVSWNSNDINNMYVDTVMTCKYNVHWESNDEKGTINLQDVLKKFNNKLIKNKISINTLKKHFPKIEDEKLTAHKWEEYYSIIGDENKSFIPLNSQLKAIKINDEKLCETLQKLVRLPTAGKKIINLNEEPKGDRKLTLLTKKQLIENSSVNVVINDFTDYLDRKSVTLVTGKDIKDKRNEAFKKYKNSKKKEIIKRLGNNYGH